MRKAKQFIPLEKVIRQNPLAGFTLIEMLLGLMIFALVAVSLYGILSSGIKISRRSDDANKIYREIQWSLDAIARDLENMATYSYSQDGVPKTAFSGGSTDVSLILPTPAGLKTVSYYLEEPQFGSIVKTVIGGHHKGNKTIVSQSESGFTLHSLIREEESFLISDEPAEKGVLSFYVKPGSLKFSYAYYQGEGENAQVIWSDTWTKEYIPFAVRVELAFVNPGKSGEALTVQRNVCIPPGFLGEE